MSDDCYWKHGAPMEKRCPRFDGKHTVCPQCCVEKCPVETPKWFGACTAAPPHLVQANHPGAPQVGLSGILLSEIFNSVKQDYGPAERMGYTLLQP